VVGIVVQLVGLVAFIVGAAVALGFGGGIAAAGVTLLLVGIALEAGS